MFDNWFIENPHNPNTGFSHSHMRWLLHDSKAHERVSSAELCCSVVPSMSVLVLIDYASLSEDT